ncbi:hypothetical protein [Vibrio anguillarum]|uniref:Uncharacterized protein n=1 Tax=Vibrio anguillarum TaxID=55601 RepID=A0AAW4BKM7_VIBAN|nr:hypothetical protein [Vibrio anguillarum]MBF4374369.1 hypothetical protein [Vibrio anguillarum]MBF4437369.1 hypothetical protein [Vibrio anguillarum]
MEIYRSTNYFEKINTLTDRDWLYILCKRYPRGHVTNAQRVLEMESISILDKSEQKIEIERLLEKMDQQSQRYVQKNADKKINSEQEPSPELQLPAKEIRVFL